MVHGIHCMPLTASSLPFYLFPPPPPLSCALHVQCPFSNCVASAPSINGDSGIDGMISVIAHEIAEAATDPYGKGWYTSDGYENADVCQME